MSIYLGRTSEMLQAHGLRRTPGRVVLLKVLATAKGPLTIENLHEELVGDLSLANLYRALESFEQHGIVTRFEFGKGRVMFELAHDKPHHHHVVCEKCGKVVDVPAKDSPVLNKTVLDNAPAFTRINRHSLEFYGVCVACA